MQKKWIDNIFQMIKYFSDINSLSNSWYGFNKEKASCFDEDVSLLFDSFSFDDFIKYIKSTNIEANLLEAIIDFRNLLFNYKEPHSGLAIDILNDPAFIKIVDSAKRLIILWYMPKNISD